mgnify:CR=1 FL=1
MRLHLRDLEAISRLWAIGWLALCLAACLIFGTGHAVAGEAQPLAANPEQEARMMSIASELRCLVCQNQTVADSHSGLAEDLRREIRELLAKGQSDQQIRDHMTQRYGDFVLYRPPVNPSTALLWFGPAVLGVLGLAVLVGVLRHRARLSDDAFEPDTPAPEDAADAAPPTPPRA